MRTKAKNFNTFLLRAAFLLLLAVTTTLTAGATQYIKDLMLIGGSESEVNSLKTTYQNQGWTVINQNLNAGCSSSSDRIYLLCKYEDSNSINFGYVADLYISTASGTAPDSRTVGDRTFYLVPYVGGSHFEEKKGDLNSNAGGADIHLYYARTVNTNRCFTSIFFNSTQSSAYGSNDNGWGTGYDLNSGAGGDYIYLHVTSATATTYTVTLAPGVGADAQPITLSSCNPEDMASSKNTANNGQFFKNDNGTIGFKLEYNYNPFATPCIFVGWNFSVSEGAYHLLNNTQTIYVAQWENGVDLSRLTSDYTIQNGEKVVGTLDCNVKISIADGATVTLSGANINRVNDINSKWAGITCLGDATIILAEGTTNNVRGFWCGYPGIYIPSGKTLTIKGSGTLNANSGDEYISTYRGYAAGIGGSGDLSCGNIIIESGTITATASSYSACIGGSSRTSCGDITIKGGRITAVSVLGTWGGSGIGSGGHSGPGSSTCGDITIEGGTIAAYGANEAAGIGTGEKGTCGNITITNGVARIDAYGSNSIGTGLNGSCGTVTIGGVVTGIISKHSFTTYPFTVAFNANGGTGTMDDMRLMYNVPRNLTDNSFTRTNYFYVAWNTRADGRGTTYVNGQNACNLTSESGATITLYAQWQSPALTDGTAYMMIEDRPVTSATYMRTLGSERVGKYQTWLVPFDYTIKAADTEKFQFYKINMIANAPNPGESTTTDQMWVFLTRLNAGAVLHANMPYVYKPKEAVTDYVFTTENATLKAKNTDVIAKSETLEDIYSFYAIYDTTTPEASDPFYYVNINGGLSLGNNGNVTVGPYRWIIRKTNKFGGTAAYAPAMQFFDGEETTGIMNVNDNDNDNESSWYSLDGMKLFEKPTQKGVYIHNGKKVVIK